MIRLDIGLEIRHGGVIRVCAIEDKTAVVVVASYRSVSRNSVRFKVLVLRFVLNIQGIQGTRFYKQIYNE